MPTGKQKRVYAFWMRTVRSLLGIVKPHIRRGRTAKIRARLHTRTWLDTAKFFKDWYLTLWIRFARTLLVRRVMLLLLVPYGRREAVYLSFDRGICKITWPW